MNLDTDLLRRTMRSCYEAASQSNDRRTWNAAKVIQPYSSNLWCASDEAVGVNHHPAPVPESRQIFRRGVLHAEEAALIEWVQRRDHDLLDLVLVCPWACCAHCASVLVAYGVQTLVRCSEAMSRPTPWVCSIKQGDLILRRAGVEIVELEPIENRPKMMWQGEMW